MKPIRILRNLKTACPFLLIAAILLTTIFFPSQGEKGDAQPRRVVRVWNVDTFEGGKGSRTAFLKNAALQAEKNNRNAYYLVTSYTAEGAKYALSEGDFPDILSFGIGLSDFAELCLPLSVSFAGGKTEGGSLAYPWCRGGYALFSLTDDFGEDGPTVISCGGSNLTAVAAAYAGVHGEERESVAAYTGFLNGKYRYLLGTQRDLCRFHSRNVTVYYRPLPQYCDLYQYISILSGEKRADCDEFLNVLFSEEVQQKLSDIGMYPMQKGDGFAEDAVRTASVFSSGEALSEIAQIARSGDLKSLDKYLKII